MSTQRDRIRAYYASFDEWSRLDSPEGALEHRRTLDLLSKHLAPASRVLDLGGGPGRYAAELARRGHRVVLADVSPALLDEARRRFGELDVAANVESIDEVDAVDLAIYANESFDAVLAFGPFYHLITPDEREAAARELHRVLRPGGLAFVAYIPRLSGILGLVERAAQRPEQVPPRALRTAAETGVFRNASDAGFQEGYYPPPGEIEALLEASGLRVLDCLSLKSVAHRLGAEVARLDAARRAEVDRLVEDLARRPEIVATGGHVLVLARRPPQSA